MPFEGLSQSTCTAEPVGGTDELVARPHELAQVQHGAEFAPGPFRRADPEAGDLDDLAALGMHDELVADDSARPGCAAGVRNRHVQSRVPFVHEGQREAVEERGGHRAVELVVAHPGGVVRASLDEPVGPRDCADAVEGPVEVATPEPAV